MKENDDYKLIQIELRANCKTTPDGLHIKSVKLLELANLKTLSIALHEHDQKISIANKFAYLLIKLRPNLIKLAEPFNYTVFQNNTDNYE